MANAVKYSTH